MDNLRCPSNPNSTEHVRGMASNVCIYCGAEDASARPVYARPSALAIGDREQWRRPRPRECACCHVGQPCICCPVHGREGR